jgi:hypothetical protein
MPQYQGVWNLQDAARLQSQQQWVTDPNFKNTTLLLQADNSAGGAQNNTFLDSSSNNFAITRNGNTTQGTFTPFSQGWSNYFDQSSRLSLDRAASSFGTNDFTIECWWLASGSQSNYAGIVAQNFSATNGGWSLKVRSLSDQVEFSYINSTPQNVTVSFNVNDGAWHHIAVTRSGTSLRVYVDGILQTTGTLPAAFSFSSGAGNTDIGYQARDNAFIRGYVSNLRLVNGTALSTGSTYPIATSPLTAVTNTSLLTCQSNRFIDNSSNAYAITVAAGSPSVQPFAPFAPQYQWTSSVIGGSGYFDGSGDYLSAAYNSAYAFTGDFTIEFWVNWSAHGSSGGLVVNMQSSGGAPAGWQICFSGTADTVNFEITNSYPLTTSSSSLPKNAWTHVAVVRSGSATNNIKMYFNGAQVAQGTSTATIDSTNASLYVGAERTLAGLTTGYISGIRILKGTAQYTAAFTPPTAPPTALTNTQLLLNFTNAGIYDGTMDNVVETVGNAQVSTSVVKYGSGSLAFDGTGDYLRLPTSPNLGVGTGDFTIEFWIYRSANGNQIIFDQRSTATQVALCIFNDGNDIIRFFVNGSNVITGGTIPLATWTHFALCKANSLTRMFFNGAQVGSTYVDTNNYVTNPLFIGAQFDTASGVNGYLDDLRITKGVARYQSNFMPPQVALPRQ